MEHVLSAIAAIFTIKVLLFMIIGTIAGIVAASIPGFTITMAVVLTMPFTFGMTPIEGLATMVAVYVGGYSGGLISGILLGIPGTPSSVCTVFDGHTMAKDKKEPGRALSLGVMSSFVGGLIGAVVCILFSVPLAKFGLNFGPWERFSLILFALTLMASLGSKSLVKGLIGGLFGLLLAVVGIDPMGGRLRYTFGINELASGFAFLPILIGLFAVPAMMKTVVDMQKERNNPNIEEKTSYIKGERIYIPWLKSLKEVLSQWVNTLRSGLIGAIVGALPAAGGTTATFLSYDQAQKFSKHPEKFGTGIPDGIIAAEASNNGVAGGSLIPTLALGVPGSAVTAVMLGVLILHGITPGPLLLRNEPVLIYSVFVALLIAHFMMISVHFVFMKYFIKLAQAPRFVLVPVVLMLCVAGSFALNSTFFDVKVFLFAGIFGFLLNNAGMPMGPVVLGVILGPMAETNLRRALMTDPSVSLFFTRPISLILIVLSVVSVGFSAYQIRKQRKNQLEDLN